MFVLSVDLRIKPENVESFIARAIENSADSRKEPGCRMYLAHRSTTDPRRLFLYEQYDDQAAVDAHRPPTERTRYAQHARANGNRKTGPE